MQEIEIYKIAELNHVIHEYKTRKAKIALKYKILDM